MTKERREIERIAKQAIAWIISPEGQAELKRVMDESEERCERMRELHKVDWRKMQEPCTI